MFSNTGVFSCKETGSGAMSLYGSGCPAKHHKTMNTTATISRPAKSRLYSGKVIAAAHAIRKEKAIELGIPVKAISWKSALHNAKKGSPLKDVWGCPLTSIGHKINLFLWSWECPVVFMQDEVVEATGLPKAKIGSYLSELASWGVLNEIKGFVSVVNAKRPYSNEVPA